MSSTLIFVFISACISGALGLTVVWYKRRALAHWAFAAGMLALAVETIFFGLSLDASQPSEVLHWQHGRLIATSFLPGLWLLFSVTYGRGNHRQSLKKYQFLLALTFLVPIGIAIAFRGQSLVPIPPTPVATTQMFGLGWPAFVLHFLHLLGFVLILMNLERTYRASVGTMRWRIKFMILGLGVLFAVRACSSSQALLFRTENISLQTIDSAALLLACLLIARSLLRTGHFEVHVYPSQAVLHKSLTVLLAGIYLVLVGGMAKVVSLLGGESSFAAKAFVVLVCLVLLAVLLLSDRVRLAIKRLVSRHFQRPIHDYRAVWRTFTDGTARCVEASDLCSVSVKLVAEVFQALSVTVWLVDEKKEDLRFGASTSLSETKAALLKIDASDAAPVISALSGHSDPIDIDASTELWAATLRRLHPDEFRKGNRICVPMIAGSELLGVMMVGDRVGGIPFLLQDFDLLKSVSDQAAASLLNIQLSQKLSQVKQLEAFQAMSTFFVHDLKNTASMLSLMLQNLPVHFHDPKFREDALRGVSKTVTHIKDLIHRLSLLRQGLTLQTVETDLNKLVSDALDGLKDMPRVKITRELRPLPKIFLDPSQIQNIVTNLVLNANDAMESGGTIKVETSQRNGWLILAVTDNGCGMTQEFIQRSLFRPFQTTKIKGIGIGMFQCKMIAEAHRGRIEVESEPGQGTEFRVLLPAQKTQ